MGKSRLFRVWFSRSEFAVIRAHSKTEARAIFLLECDEEYTVTKVEIVS